MNLFEYAMFQSVLMLCIGNVCRSPVAEGLLKLYSDTYQLNLTVNSAGIAALVRQHAQPFSIALAEEHHIDIAAHKAQQITPELVVAHELILVMDETILQAAIKMFPLAIGKFKKLGHFSQTDIDDPYQKPREAYEAMYASIEKCTNEWMKHAWKVDL